jgi:SAM-dependent methyltransferase
VSTAGRGAWKRRVRDENRERSEAVLEVLLATAATVRVTRLLDVGCGDAAPTSRWSEAVAARSTFGVDVNRDHLRRCRIPVLMADLERGGLPLASASVDAIVLHQVLEHLKNVHHAVAECNRVLRPGGLLAVGLPNLASAHNRLLLLAGRQPTFIQVRSPHVRGLTRSEALAFLESFGFRTVRSRGAGFYPLVGRWMAALDRRLPGLAAFQCHLLTKVDEVPGAALTPFATADTNYSGYPGRAW